MSPASDAGGDGIVGDGDLLKGEKLAARRARFDIKLPGNRYKELSELRATERKAFLEQGLITSGQTQLADAIDLRGTCEGMCSEYEMEFREFTREIHPFEALPNRRMDHSKAVAAYTRSDAGAGHGEAAILPSDLRTPAALVRSLDYLITRVMPIQPSPNPNAVRPTPPTPRIALGYSAGYIRDRTRAIRKEFAMQSSWGHEEAIATFERIARWHILCLRELQEETGSATDMHIDSAELGRCFTSLRQHYNDRREELGLDVPCPNEPEFRAYMLIYDLTSKSVAIPMAELPAVILDHPLVQVALQIRQAAQRNFDSQKEGSKHNAEYGANLITRFVRLLKQQKVPYLLSCLVEIRLREIRRSAIRALTRTYPRLKGDPVRYGESGEVLERRMITMGTLDRILGAEEQEEQGPAFEDIVPVSKSPNDESAAIVERFGMGVHRENGEPVGALINIGAPFNDNKDAPYTRRWRFITDKLGSTTYADVVNGRAGVAVDGAGAAAAVIPAAIPAWQPPPRAAPAPIPKANGFTSTTVSEKSAFAPAASAFPSAGAFSSSAFPAKSAFSSQPGQSMSAFSTKPPTSSSAFPPASASASAFPAKPPLKREPVATPKPAEQPTKVSTTPAATPEAKMPSFFPSVAKSVEPTPVPAQTPPLFTKPSFFDNVKPPALSTSTSEPPKAASIPNFFTSATVPAAAPSTPIPTPPAASLTPLAPIPRVKKEVPRPRVQEPPRIRIPRDKFRSSVQQLTDRLMDEVVANHVKARPDIFERIVAVYQAEEDLKRKKSERQQRVRDCAPAVLEQAVETYTPQIIARALGEVLHEKRLRTTARRIIKQWRRFAQKRQQERIQEEKRRQSIFDTIGSMGLRQSTVTFKSSVRGPSVTPSSLVVDEEEIDRDLMETKFDAEDLREASSFLRSIAQHVSPLLRGARKTPEFEIVLLTAEHAGRPASEDGRDWLIDKLSPEDEGELHHRGVDYCLTVSDVRGSFPGSSSAGLVILEAPLTGISKSQEARNAEDAQERIEAATAALQQRSRYRPHLLIVSWEGETDIDTVVDRLGIAQDITEFTNVGLISLEDGEALDDRFAMAIQDLITSDPRKTQVTIDLLDVSEILSYQWRRLTSVVQLYLEPGLAVGAISSAALEAGVTLLCSVAEIIASAIDAYPLDPESTYDPLRLPPLPGASAEEISTYLSQPPLASMGAVALAVGPWRAASALGEAPPTSLVLDALGTAVLGRLRGQTLALEQWLEPEHAGHAASHLLKRIEEEFTLAADGCIRSFARAARPAQDAVLASVSVDDDKRMAVDTATAITTALPASPPSSPASVRLNGSKKRPRDDEQENIPETTASKTAKLLRALGKSKKVLASSSKVLASYG